MPAEREREGSNPRGGAGLDACAGHLLGSLLSRATPQQIKSTTKTTNKGANRKEVREETTTT